MSSDIDSPQLQKDFSLQATNLLENRRNSVQKLRQALISFQAIAESIISVKELAHLNEKWRVGKVQVYGGSFRDAVNRAYGLLGLLEYNFIVELRQRGVMGIHPYWLDGHLQMEYLLLKRAMGDTRRDIYGIENANRILCTLRAICEAEANDIFPVPISGLAKTNLRGGHILITRSDSLELRPIDVPEEISATLPLGVPPPRQAEAVKIHGDVTIVAHDDQRIFLWDPRRASTPYQEWTPPPDDGTWIKYAVHQETFEGLRTVAILPGSVIELRDLAFHKEYEVAP